MSCGNRFQCALRKPSRFSFQPDKPSNPELHNENEKRLNELLKAREDIDKQFFSANTKPSNTNVMTVTRSNIQTDFSNLVISDNEKNNDNFTPWKTPSAEWKSK